MSQDLQLTNFIGEDIVHMLMYLNQNNDVRLDYRIVGNSHGTTIVMRFDQPYENMHDSTQVTINNHKSPAARRRDLYRSVAHMNNTGISSIDDKSASMPLGSVGKQDSRPAQSVNNNNTCKHNIEIVKDTCTMNLMKTDNFDKGTEHPKTDQMNNADNSKYENDLHGSVKNVKSDDNKKTCEKGLTCNGTVSDETAATKNGVHEEFKTIIRNNTRNRAYHRFANEKIDGHTHVLAMTDDLIVDINKDTRKVNSFNPTDEQYKNLHALLLERGDLGSCVNQKDMFFLISTLPDIIKVQVMKTDFHN